jgi:hypothetical protein
MKKSIAALVLALMFSPQITFAAAAIADTLNLTTNTTGGANQNPSFSYTTPAGSDLVFWVHILGDNTATPTAELGGVSLTIVANFVSGRCSGSINSEYIGYLINPPAGTNTFAYHKGAATAAALTVFTTSGTDQTTPLDAYYCTQATTANGFTSTTTPSANDLILSWGEQTSGKTGSSHGAGQTEMVNNDDGVFFRTYGSYVQGSSTPTTLQGVSENYTTSAIEYVVLWAIKASAAAATGGGTNNDDANWFLLLFAIPPLRKRELV